MAEEKMKKPAGGPGGRGPMSVNLDKAKNSKATIKRLLKYLEGSKKILFVVVLFIIAYVVLNTSQSIMLQPIIDDYIVPLLENPADSEAKLGCIRMIATLFIICMLTAVCSFLQSKFMIKVSQKVVKQLRDEVFAKIQKLPIRYFVVHPSGELMSKIVNDIDNISIALNTSINQLISGVLTVIVILVILFVINPILATISLISLPIILFVVGKIANYNKAQFIKQQEALAEVNGYIEEYVSGQKVIKAFNKENDVKEEFNNRNENLRKNGFMAQTVAGMVMPIMGNISNITTAITTVLAGIFCINGKITLGTITIFSKFSKEYSRPITEISNQFNVIQAGIAGAERIFEILDEAEEYPYNSGKPVIGEIKGHVEFKDVDFGYPEKEKALVNVNIDAKPGETIAIVGPTGAGKTTIVDLLIRFYDVRTGKILIDGKDIRDVDKNSLRNSIGIVLQDTVLFSDTIMENIRYGRLDATDEEVIEAAKLADAHSFIKRLPNGYDIC